jgi:hypothetical protein
MLSYKFTGSQIRENRVSDDEGKNTNVPGNYFRLGPQNLSCRTEKTSKNSHEG